MGRVYPARPTPSTVPLFAKTSTSVSGTAVTSPTSTFTPNTPAAPALSQRSSGGLTVTWTAPAVDDSHSAATAYAARFSPSGAGTWTTVAGASSPYALTSLTASAAYDVEVQASNSAGASAWSATCTANTAAAVSTGPFAPNAPAAPTLAQGTSGNLIVTWATPGTDGTHNAATAYSLRSSPSGANTWTTVSAATSPYDITGLAAGTAFDVEIEASNAGGASAWSAISTASTAAAAGGPGAPNPPVLASVVAPPNGAAGELVVTWPPPATDATHGAATGYNLRSSPTGANSWTVVTGATSPYTMIGLTGGSAYDIEVQGTDAASSPGTWSSTVTGTTWGATVVPGTWVAATSQAHGSGVSPNGGANMIVVAAPTAVSSAVFAWSSSNSAVPGSGLVSTAGDGQTNGWGAYFSAPATAGTYYLWMLAQGTGSATIGALVTSAITVS